MNIDKILVTLAGAGLIGFIWWFFFEKKSSHVESGLTSEKQGTLKVVVDGGYKPSAIKIKKGEETTLTIFRKDSNSCLEEIVLPDFKISKYLPLGKEVEIKITPQKEGVYPFHCGMNMFHGKIIVE